MIRRLLADRRAATAVMVAGSMPALIGAAAYAVDIGSVELQRRTLQGLADDAAATAAGNINGAQGQAQSAVSQSNSGMAINVSTETGSYSPLSPLTNGTRFVPGSSAPNAVRVTLSTTAPTFFAIIFGQRGVPISRSAVAARVDQASFSIGSRLASLDGGLLNQYLGTLTGGNVSLSVLDYQALANADVDLVGFTDALRVTANLGSTGNRNSLLQTQVTGSQALNAAANATTDAVAAAALHTLAALCVGVSSKTAPLIDLGSLGETDSGGTGLVKVNALALATALLQQGSGKHVIDLDMGASVVGLSSTRLKIALGERAQNAPWVTVTDNGEPIIRTAQARLYVQSKVSAVTLTGISGLVDLNVPVFAEVAGGQAHLSTISCSGNNRRVTLSARTDPAIAALADADTSQFGDFNQPVALTPAKVLDTLLVDVSGYARVDTGQDEPWQSVSFTQSEIDSGTKKTISSSTLVQGVASSVTQNVQMNVSVAGLVQVNTGSLTSAIGAQLQSLAPTLDSLINVTTGAIGVHYGQADVWVRGMRCGQPTLVG